MGTGWVVVAHLKSRLTQVVSEPRHPPLFSELHQQPTEVQLCGFWQLIQKAGIGDVIWRTVALDCCFVCSQQRVFYLLTRKPFYITE